jgi:hypothetical protein
MGFGGVCKEKNASFFCHVKSKPKAGYERSVVTRHFMKDEVFGLRIMGGKKPGWRADQMQPAGG